MSNRTLTKDEEKKELLRMLDDYSLDSNTLRQLLNALSELADAAKSTEPLSPYVNVIISIWSSEGI